MSFEADQYLLETARLTEDGVRVTFVDGLEGVVPLDEMSPSGEVTEINRRSIDESGGRRIEFQKRDETTIEYPWDFFRRIVDEDFEELEERENQDAREKLGQHVRELRNDRSLSQQELAERSGLDRTTISRLERGKHQAGFDTLHSIAAGLQISIQEVVKIEEDPTEHAA